MKTWCKAAVLLFVLAAAGAPGWAADESTAAAAGADSPMPSSEETLPLAWVSPGTDSGAGAAAQELTLREYVRLVRDHNEQISYQDSEWAVSLEAVKGARAIFEPAFVGNYQYQDDNRKNTVQELISEGFVPEFREKSKNYQAAIEGLAPTGAKVRLGYSLRDFSNTIEQRYGVEREAQTVLGASFAQPLLKGAGIESTMAVIRVAEAEADIAFQTYRGQVMRVISDAIGAYWDLVLARERYRVRQESEHNAEELLKQNIARAQAGKIPETEVLEARAGLAMRNSLVSEARQGIVVAMNTVRTFFSASAAVAQFDVLPADPLEGPEAKPNFADGLDNAFKFRAEYLASRRKIEREEVKLVYAENQRWPQLDLKGSYNLNGLTGKPGSSWDDALKAMNNDYETWSVGLELRIPLGGDKKAKSELEATKQRKRQALLEMKAVEVALANAVDTTIKGVSNAREQVSYYGSIVEMTRQLLETEHAKFDAGKSNSRLVLEREENLNKAREAEIESLVKYRKALYQLELAEGTLLANQGIEVMEEGL